MARDWELPDEPDRSPDRKAGATDAPRNRAADPPAPRAEQLAEHARYREVVETRIKLAAASDAWTRAAPELQAEWAAHKQRYPAPDHQAASTQPDGGWLGDGHRRLSPEQNAEATKCAADLRDEATLTIRPALDRIAAADPSRHLAGLEHMLKGEDRLKEKLADELTAKPGLGVRAALDKVADAVRFTLVYGSERYAEGVLSDVARLKAEGFELIKLKNLWHTEQYKGVNSQWRLLLTGARFEMQFHTPESREAKESTHEAYERLRSAAASPTEERDFTEEQSLEDFQRRANALLMTPPGIEAIEDFPRKKEQNRG